jgi:geranylgeranyl diphosphate synthase, type II
MHSINQFQEFICEYLNSNHKTNEPNNLYQPVKYILGLGGKKIRPVLTLLTAEIFHADYKRALPAAAAIEVFHNFSLVHDDIMDNAPLRRGNETIHEKWNTNTAILSGDAMMILAYQYFELYEPKIFRKLAKLFSKTALEVFEGQQYDVDFETRNDVTISEYLRMIEYKTAVLIAAAMKMGAIVAQASKEDAKLIYIFGLNLGMAFQLQDDYLDAFGNPKTFGKQVGGDIIENKKTFLYIKALEFAKPTERAQLVDLFSTKSQEIADKINTVKQLFDATGASQATIEAIKEYSEKAFEILQKLDISEEGKSALRFFGKNLIVRNS